MSSRSTLLLPWILDSTREIGKKATHEPVSTEAMTPNINDLTMETWANQAMTAAQSGRWMDALLLMGQVCEATPSDNPSYLTFAAVAARNSLFDELARTYVRRALACNPNHLAAARIGLDTLDGKERAQCARTLFARDHSNSIVAKSAAILAEREPYGYSLHIVGGNILLRTFTKRRDTRISAFADWTTAEFSPREVPLPENLVTPLKVSEWRFAKPSGPASLRFIVEQDGHDILDTRLNVSLDPTLGYKKGFDGECKEARHTLNVVIPIFGDAVATATCLKSLRRQACEHHIRKVILVNDASPDARILKLLGAYRSRPGFTVIDLPYNLGFTGAVNHGLSQCVPGDVLLLNSDTVLPPSALDRLVLTSRKNPHAGTLTPFSNNGQYTSFPRPFQQNRMMRLKDLRAISDTAWRVNQTATARLPSGIGFCLYIREECIAICRNLGEQFSRGYYEDVDFCLRTESAGWSNVCATGVFVGHRGSRSFRDGKTYLASRNRGILDKLHPSFSRRAAAWLLEDPLRSFRSAIEDRLPHAPRSHAALLLASHHWSQSDLQSKAGRLFAGGVSRVFCAAKSSAERKATLSIRALDSQTPQNLHLALGESLNGELAKFVKRYGIDRTVVLDPTEWEPSLVSHLASLTRLMVFEEAGAPPASERQLLPQVDISVHSALSKSRYLPSRSGSFAATTNVVSDFRSTKPSKVFEKSSVQTAKARCLALVPVIPSAANTAFVLSLIRELAACSELPAVVLGKLLGNKLLPPQEGVPHFSNVSLQGYEALLQLNSVTHVMIISKSFLPEHPLLSTARAWHLPLARLRHPFERRDVNTGDFTINASRSVAEITDEIIRWAGQHIDAQVSVSEFST